VDYNYDVFLSSDIFVTLFSKPLGEALDEENKNKIPEQEKYNIHIMSLNRKW